MDKLITNTSCATMSVQAVNDVLNIKIILKRLNDLQYEYDLCKDKEEVWNLPLIKQNIADHCAMLHKHIAGWS